MTTNERGVTLVMLLTSEVVTMIEPTISLDSIPSTTEDPGLRGSIQVSAARINEARVSEATGWCLQDRL